MSHGYNPAGNVSGGQWQAAYQQQGQAVQSAQPQGSQQYAAPQSAPASGYQGAGGYPQGGPQQYAHPQGGPQQYVAPQSAPASGYQGVGGYPQGNPQQYAGQQYPPPQSGQQYVQPQGGPQQYAAPQSVPASGQGAGGYVQGGQQYAQLQQLGQQQFVQSGQGGAPQVASQQYAGQQYPPPQAGQQYGGAQHAQPQQYVAPQSAPASGQGAGGHPQGNPQQYAQPQQYAAPQSAPSQQASAQLAKDPRADDWVRLKGRANVAILNSALRFFGFPFLSLLIGFARAHDVYDAAKQLGAPSDVLLRARIAMGTAAFFFFLQIAILVVVVIGANM